MKYFLISITVFLFFGCSDKELLNPKALSPSQKYSAYDMNLSVDNNSTSLLFVDNTKRSFVDTQGDLKEQALQKTRTGYIAKKDGKPIAFLTITYINEIISKYVVKNDKVDRFIVGVYIQEKENDFIFDELVFSANEVDMGFLKKIDKDDKVLDVLPFKNPWTKYYYTETADTQSTVLLIHVDTPFLDEDEYPNTVSFSFKKKDFSQYETVY